MSVVSVIVPVYKVEPYIRRCVDSVLNQTFSDFELILVDDGSPDNSGKICDEYALKDNRIHVIHQENGGLSAARNAGLDWVLAKANSRWVTFIDSDDWVHPQMLEILLRNAESASVKVSVCGYLETSSDDLRQEPKDIICQTWAPEDFFLEHNTNAVIACAKLYCIDCFLELRYPVGKLHEDEFTTYRILFAQKQIAVTDAQLYYYFQNNAGITRSQWNPRRLDVLTAQKEQVAFFQKHGFNRAHDYVAVCHIGKICQHRKMIGTSALQQQEKRRYQSLLAKELRDALRSHWRICCRRSNLDVFFEVFPVLGKIYHAVRAK